MEELLLITEYRIIIVRANAGGFGTFPTGDLPADVDSSSMASLPFTRYK